MASLPTTMKGVQIARNGGPEVLEYKTDLPVPTLQPGEVLVKNEFLGVNFIDTYFRTGLYKAPSLPLILGREGAGHVADIHPSVTTFKPGDAVVYCSPKARAYAEYTAVLADELLHLPAGVSTQQGAASILQGLTAWTFVQEAGQVKSGQWVLVHAAAGGVGTQLVQMLKAVGARVIGTASNEEKCRLAKKNGAEFIINSKEGNLVDEAMKITGGHGVDVIFDGIGKATFDADLEMVARKGTIVVFGNASGAVPPVDILRLGAKNVRLIRPTYNMYVVTREELEKYSSELFEFLTSGKVEVGIHKVYALSDVASAHSDLEGRKTTGKLVLKVGE